MYYCECADRECHTKVGIRASDYERIRKNSAYFFVLPGHEAAEIETVIESHDDWIVVEKDAHIREIAEATWQQLDLLADPGGDTPEVHAKLDVLRRDYGLLYAEAEALARSSVDAAGPAYLEATREAAASDPADASAPRRAYLRTRRAAGRVKRRLRDGG